ncbi:aminoglycoside phosphotransferase family protein [Frankia sp. AgB1.9]|uniref:phosphotransferase n=1 Tax=unclassified Frankia TaxID=2632575 RepID=UPI0019314BE1|nr:MULTISPECIES: aminoglycoside phosphotransferase family protein [unclassified Frankia]MBL7489646.1 aminoglycoside phosphotransferase family protein [Frankia sp. AgW1.1]MBL7548612.1 aminoglycoside phosphotransferase family protein [Frankia sp. AgB1.9]MBL7621564.1 aminoglycoside phosphotransferase family protein [Frankia sp. AgB1.8]
MTAPAAPTSPPLPDTLDELLTPGWLTAALGRRFPGVEVRTVTPGAVISRVATNARFQVEWVDGAPAAGLSPNLCAKGYFTEAGREFRQAGEPEAFFYRDVAAGTGMRTLRTVYADVDPASHNAVVITEDVVTEGATFLDARSPYTPDQAAESLDQLARLHAATWNRPALATAGWLAPRLDTYLIRRGVTEIRENFAGPIGAGVPEPARDAERLAAGYRTLAARSAAAADWAVIHGDAHVGNLYLDGAGRPSFVDWQLVQRGPWYLDVGYHLASALTVEDRRGAERDLVRHYLDRLRAGGVEPPAWDDAWLGVRRGIVHGFFLWGITLRVDPAVTALLLTRLGTAAADHDALAAVELDKEW